MRFVGAALILGVALAAAVAIGTHRATHSASNCSTGGYGSPTRPCSWTTRPAWSLPGAIVIAFAGLGISAAVMARRRVGV